MLAWKSKMALSDHTFHTPFSAVYHPFPSLLPPSPPGEFKWGPLPAWICIIPQATVGLPQGLLSVWHVPPQRGDIRARCPNHLHWLLSLWVGCDSSQSSLWMFKLLTCTQGWDQIGAVISQMIISTIRTFYLIMQFFSLGCSFIFAFFLAFGHTTF